MTRPLELLVACGQRHGALVEHLGEESVEIVAPPSLAAALGVPEHARYASQPDGGGLWIGFGTPVFERLLEHVTRAVPWTACRLASPPPLRDGAARAALGRLALRNAVFDPISVLAGTAQRVVVFARCALVADDRRELLLDSAAAVGSGVAVPDFWSALPRWGPLVAASGRPDPAALMPAAVAALGRLEPRARAHGQGFIEAFARRQCRDRERTEEYFAGLAREVKKRGSRLAPADLRAKTEAIRREREAKLRELDERARVRVEVLPIAAVLVEVPVTRIVLHVRRRKLDRTLDLQYDATTAALVPPACAVCGEAAAAPALCDDALHPVCSSCVADASGRWPCPACRRRS